MILSKSIAGYSRTLTHWRPVAGALHGCSRLGCRFVLMLALVGVSQTSSAWSEGGHIAIAELAVRELSTRERDTLNQIAETLAAQNHGTGDLVKRYGAHSSTALTAAWTDGIRGRDLEDIFGHYGHQVPPELRAYRKETTDDWHYSNIPFFDSKGKAERFKAECPALNSGRLKIVLPLLQKSFVSAEDPRDKAIVLAMLVHLVADAHQPLHSVTRITRGCDHDRGGNGFCVAAQETRGRCKDNLHHAWDTGFGFFYQKDFDTVLTAIASQRLQQTDVSVIQDRMEPNDWQKENMLLAEAIYDTVEGKKPNQAYREMGEKIVRQRAYLASRRLAAVLRELVQKDADRAGAGE